MLTKTELENAFKVHFNEMDNCEEHKCYWALLHLESQNGDILNFGYATVLLRGLVGLRQHTSNELDVPSELVCSLLNHSQTVQKARPARPQASKNWRRTLWGTLRILAS